jgi:hypothetical protein
MGILPRIDMKTIVNIGTKKTINQRQSYLELQGKNKVSSQIYAPE